MKQGPEYTMEANIKMCDMEFYVSLIGGLVASQVCSRSARQFIEIMKYFVLGKCLHLSPPSAPAQGSSCWAPFLDHQSSAAIWDS